MSCVYEKRNADGETVAAVTGAAVSLPYEEVSATYEGVPVRIVAPRAFAGNQTIREISLPESIRVLGAFAFHNCKALYRITMTDSVTDYGGGVIRACTKLSEVDMTMRDGNFALIARLLADSDYTLSFHLQFEDGRAHLVFPGFVYDFAENTMARKIQFHIEGSGMAYRECVTRTAIDYAAYDKLFERALLDEIPIITEVALSRLLYPYRLSDRAREAYEAYLEAHATDVVRGLMKRNDTEKIRYMTTTRLIPAATYQELMEETAQALPAVRALLMEGARSVQGMSLNRRLTI